MIKVGDGRNLLVQPYPIELAQHAFHRPQHRQHSSRKQLGHRPVPNVLVKCFVNCMQLPIECGRAIVLALTSCCGGRARVLVSDNRKGCVQVLPLGMCL